MNQETTLDLTEQPDYFGMASASDELVSSLNQNFDALEDALYGY